MRATSGADRPRPVGAGAQVVRLDTVIEQVSAPGATGRWAWLGVARAYRAARELARRGVVPERLGALLAWADHHHVEPATWQPPRFLHGLERLVGRPCALAWFTPVDDATLWVRDGHHVVLTGCVRPVVPPAEDLLDLVCEAAGARLVVAPGGWRGGDGVHVEVWAPGVGPIPGGPGPAPGGEAA